MAAAPTTRRTAMIAMRAFFISFYDLTFSPKIHKLYCLNMLYIIFLNVFSQLFSLNDFNISSKPDNESANAFEAGDGCIEDPVFSVFLEVFIGHWILLHKKRLSATVELEFDGDGILAGHPEHINLEAVVVRFMLPRLRKNLNLIDTGDLEYAVPTCLNIPGPDIYHFGSEVKRLYDAVTSDVAVAGRIIPEDYLPLAIPSRDERLNIGGIVAAFRIISNASAVIDAVEFPFEVLFERIVDRQVLNHIIENICLLLGEIDELGKVRKSRGHLLFHR